MTGRICSVAECEKAVRARGYCTTHYAKGQREQPTRLCSIEGCSNPYFGRSYCSKHYTRARRHGDPLWEPEPIPVCSVEGCGRAHYGHGYCHMHYQRWRDRGEVGTAAPQFIVGDDARRFWSHVDCEDGPIHPLLGQCWEWTGVKDHNGYGQFGVGDTRVLAHRFALELTMGMFWPHYQHLTVDHKCRNTACCNPTHLRPASQKQQQQNTGLYRSNTSGVKGVTWHKAASKWMASLCHEGKDYYGGLFVRIEDAAAAREVLEDKYFTHHDVNRLTKELVGQGGTR